MLTFISQIINGLNQSAVLLIATLGLLIIFGLMNVINMAHGEMIMVGAFVTYIATSILNIPFLIALVLSFVVTALFGALTEVTIIKKLYSKPTETILATYALSIILKEIARIIWPLSQNVNMPFPGTISLGGVIVPRYNIFVVIMAILLLTFTIIFFRFTKFGKKIGAITQNRQMTECLGIKTSTIDTLTFAYGAGLAGIAGCILAPTTGVSYDMGSTYLTDSFMTVVVGGVQSLIGAAFSSTIIGEGRTVLAGVSNDTWAKIMIFLAVIILIRFKPEGLFAKERR
ncbi:MAG: urea ABC transporter permease subunit UrtB [Clostridia bacterium]|jgi:urea transport system permease protein|nr:urea ABC transporter permease subunit UrtB [Clostridia bacterium]MCI1999666.1 urea ABC transporter permease subunit UrtB [Clostridia bacterium]MCI2013955.1 urea ABC transporter permease subunit UrtB [Clostridia bacterium]